MSKRYLIYCFVVLTLLLTPHNAGAQTAIPYGPERLLAMGNDDLIGTSRYVGLCGAMTAVGGDPSAVKLNPAGLGIYRHSQFSVTGEGQFRRFWQQDYTTRGPLYARWHLAQISYVIALTHPQRVAGVVSNNIMISYAKRANIVRHITLNDYATRVAGQDWIETTIDESGYRNDADIHYAMNVSNRFYWGIGFTVEWLQLRQTLDRREYNTLNRRGSAQEYDYTYNAQGRAVGCAGSIGFLVHPVQALRIGASLESPVVGRMRETDYYTETIRYLDSQGGSVLYDSPDYPSNWQMTTPLKFSAGIGLQWREHGLLSLQYDLQYHKLLGVAHTARAGLEVVLGRHWMIDAGYAYATLYNRQRASVGLNYVGRWLRVGAAYSHGWSRGTILDWYYGTQQGLFRTNENKIALTFQWNT